MGNKRVLTSLVLIPILYVIVWMLPSPYFRGLAAVAAVIGLHEFYRMADSRGTKPLSKLGMVLGALIVLGAFSGTRSPDAGLLFGIVLSLFAVLTGRLFSSRPVEGALEDSAVTIFGILYVAMLFGFQVAIHKGNHGKEWLVLLYLVIWASDTGAYYVGTAFGRRRLYEKISPKKSVEGLIGGVLASIGVALLCRMWLLPSSLGPAEAAFMGGILALVGTIGDLAESLLKRSAGIKDSGTLIPGHGGILDRMDSMLFAAPVLYFYLRMR